MNREPHPAAELSPLLTGAEYESFKEDIAEKGLLEPIWLCDGKILDGRNRYRACVELRIEPRFRNYDGDSPVAFAWSLNGKRRHLSVSQLSMIAVKMSPALKEEAKQRQGQRTDLNIPANLQGSERGEAIAQAADIVGVSPKSAYNAQAVSIKAPELAVQIEAGTLSVNKAHKIMRARSQARAPHISRGQPREQRVAEITRLAGEGHRAEQIAHELGISEDRVRHLAGDADVKLPDAVIGKTRRIDARRVIEETVNGLSGYALGLQTINGALCTIEQADAEEWASSLTESLKPLNQLRKQLVEIANG